jgi:hypothetical protein
VYLASIYGRTGNISDRYAAVYDLLVLDASNFIVEISNIEEALNGLHRWLSAVRDEEMGFIDFAYSSFEITKRKRDYILSSLENNDSPLAQEVKETLKNAKINLID